MRVRRSTGEGREVVFVHAALADGSEWDALLDLAPPGVRAVAVDLPDFGYDAPGTTLASLEASFREHLAGRHGVTLVGHSLGAWVVARALAAAAPSVRRAVLIAGLAGL